MVDIERLAQLKLHDVGFENFHLDFEKRIVRITYSVYDETTGLYSSLEIVFFNISNLKMDELHMTDIQSLEIYDHQVANRFGLPFIKFVMLTGFGKPSFNLEFNFAEYTLALV